MSKMSKIFMVMRVFPTKNNFSTLKRLKKEGQCSKAFEVAEKYTVP